MDTKRKVIQLCSLDMINRVRKRQSLSLPPLFPENINPYPDNNVLITCLQMTVAVMDLVERKLAPKGFTLEDFTEFFIRDLRETLDLQVRISCLFFRHSWLIVRLFAG
jgi:hypothetical protein